MMNSGYAGARAREDFNRARNKATLTHILSLLKKDKDNLLSLQDVKSLVKPEAESYKGMKTVPISLIAGSEGRYHDFNRYFLPRHSRLKGRWVRVDMAHHQDIVLPPVHLYEIGGVYFVRDGNHRVSVAKLQGVDFIDAEVISLSSRVSLRADMTKEELRRAVIDLEKKEFFDRTRLDELRSGVELDFTATGRYDEIIRHINGHKYYLNLASEEEISFEKGMLSWYDNVYEPIIRIIKSENLLSRFPGRTAADLYVWIVRHWDELKKHYGEEYSMEDAARDFKARFGISLGKIFKELWFGLRDILRSR